jgi:hypothetical protein
MSDEPDRPRRRRRRTSAPGEDLPSADPIAEGSDAVAQYVAPATDDAAAAGEAARPGKRRLRGSAKGRESADRGLRELVGNTPTQLGPVGAMRGRDVNRPTEDDLAAAERDVVVVRRHWTPPS